jgi:hypothetical protein
VHPHRLHCLRPYPVSSGSAPGARLLLAGVVLAGRPVGAAAAVRAAAAAASRRGRRRRRAARRGAGRRAAALGRRAAIQLLRKLRARTKPQGAERSPLRLAGARLVLQAPGRPHASPAACRAGAAREQAGRGGGRAHRIVGRVADLKLHARGDLAQLPGPGQRLVRGRLRAARPGASARATATARAAARGARGPQHPPALRMAEHDTSDCERPAAPRRGARRGRARTASPSAPMMLTSSG